MPANLECRKGERMLSVHRQTQRRDDKSGGTRACQRTSGWLLGLGLLREMQLHAPPRSSSWQMCMPNDLPILPASGASPVMTCHGPDADPVSSHLFVFYGDAPVPVTARDASAGLISLRFHATKHTPS